jgi:hypothetical protein
MINEWTVKDAEGGGHGPIWNTIMGGTEVNHKICQLG